MSEEHPPVPYAKVQEAMREMQQEWRMLYDRFHKSRSASVLQRAYGIEDCRRILRDCTGVEDEQQQPKETA